MASEGTNSEQSLQDGAHLTKAQMLLWTGQQLTPDVPLYNMAAAWAIHGSIDRDVFVEAFASLVAEADALRTVIEVRDGVPIQIVLDSIDDRLPVVDLSAESDPTAAARAWTQRRTEELLDIATRTFDSALLILDDDRHVWYLNQHHLVTDAWSMAVLYDALSSDYSARRSGEGAVVAIEPYEAYRSYELRQRTETPGPDHWKRFRDRSTAEPVLYGHRGPTGTRNERHSFDLGLERSDRLRELAVHPDVRSLTVDLTIFRIFATALFAYLHRVSGNDEITIATPTHNRMRTAFTRSVGLFTELFPVGVEVESDDTFRSLLAKVQVETDAFLRAVGPGRSDPDLVRGANCVLNVIRAGFDDFDGLPVTVRWLHPGHVDPSHQLRLQVHDLGRTGSYQLDFDASADIFDDELAERARSHFLRVLDAFLDDLDHVVAGVDLLGDDERRELAAATGQGVSAWPGETVLTRFDEQVATIPEAAAIRHDERIVTYRELDELASNVAAQLHGRGMGPGATVGVCTPRSIEAVVAMLGTLMAGAAYVPIDPRWPEDRIALILDDSEAALTLTAAARPAGLPTGADHLVVETRPVGKVLGCPPRPTADGTAYVMYTSGSTGRPKGVVIQHGALANYVGWAGRHYGDGKPLSFPLFSPLTFDLTVTSIFVPLCSGGSVVMYPETGTRADMAVLRVFEEDLVDVVKLTPSHLALLDDRHLAGVSRLSRIILGGEDLSVHLARRVWQALGGRVAIDNEYGPTEATVGCIVHTFDPGADTAGSVPIGRPIDNMAAHVLSEGGQLLPVGVVGELHLAGAGLAAGYCNRAELTAQRFVSHPGLGDIVLYRTGDRARWRADGVIEYLGRGDDQVKVRGARVELGEVEWALASHPDVVAAVAATTRRDGPTSSSTETIHCARCGLASEYPGASYDENRVCALCRSFDSYRNRAQAYFRSMSELRTLFDEARSTRTADYDCIALLSGGKDSTYVLCQLVDMGLDVLAFTLDNGFISDEAKANIERVTTELGVDHVFGSTPAMNEIFVDSLNRHCNVCQGCFKTIYTLSTKLANDRGIPFIVTGLSRGQFFETRLTEELFTELDVGVEQIDQMVLDARKAYHRVDDAVNRLLDVRVFDDDDVFERVQFVDFYRYCPVELDELLDYLATRVPWVRPGDTGRSTNCLINDVGIYIHKRERGFHNYSLPYSWDVRMGHKQRDEALAELDDDIDIERVQTILEEIGYTADASAGGSVTQLVGYYAAAADIPPADLREHVAARLPEASVPTNFVRLDDIPLSANGKVDRRALPQPARGRPEIETAYVEPRTETERVLAAVWCEVLGVERIGMRDDFFQLGGDSIMAIQIVARAQRFGVTLTPTVLFDTPNIEGLAQAVTAAIEAADEGPGHGTVGLTPAQLWLFEQDQPHAEQWNQVLYVAVPDSHDESSIGTALSRCVEHHGALRQSFERDATGHWRSEIVEHGPPVQLLVEDVTDLDEQARADVYDAVEVQLNRGFDLRHPPLLAAALFHDADGDDLLLMVAHHLIVDAVSWSVLLDDLGDDQLPPATGSLRRWTDELRALAGTESADDRAYWRETARNDLAAVPRDHAETGAATVASEQTITVELPVPVSSDLLHRAPTAGRITVHELLVAAVSRTLADWMESDDVRLFVEGHGRDALPEIDISRTVGWFTSIYPVALRVPSTRAASEVITAVKEQLRSLPAGGAHYGVLRYLDVPERQHEVSIDHHDHVLFNYLGRVDPVGAAGERFRAARPLGLHRSADLHRAFLLEVTARFVDERLRVEWSYSSDCHSEATITRWAARLSSDIEALVAACLTDEGVAATRSDFPLADLDDRKLGLLAGLLDSASGDS